MAKKGNPDFKPMSEEQREEVRLKRIAAQEWAKTNLKDDFDDEPVWRALGSEYGVRFPQRHVPATELKYLKRTCKKLGMEISTFLESTGFTTLKQLVSANKTYPSWAFVGLILEFHHDHKTNGYKYPSNID
ncbi:hypothetical protein D3C87_1773690 [compost metagenome]